MSNAIIVFNRSFAISEVRDGMLPLGMLGTSGGYGMARHHLKVAVKQGNWHKAAAMFDQLVKESVSEIQQEYGETQEQAYKSLVEMLNETATELLYRP